MSETDKIEGIGDILIEQVRYLWNLLKDTLEFCNFQIFEYHVPSIIS